MFYTVHGILQARILEWVAFLFFRGSFQPNAQTQVSHIAGSFFYQLSLRILEWVAYPSPEDLPNPGINRGLLHYRWILSQLTYEGSPSGKEPPANAGDMRDVGLIHGLRRSPGGGHGNPFQYSCLENPVDKGA